MSEKNIISYSYKNLKGKEKLRASQISLMRVAENSINQGEYDTAIELYSKLINISKLKSSVKIKIEKNIDDVMTYVRSGKTTRTKEQKPISEEDILETSSVQTKKEKQQKKDKKEKADKKTAEKDVPKTEEEQLEFEDLDVNDIIFEGVKLKGLRLKGLNQAFFTKALGYAVDKITENVKTLLKEANVTLPNGSKSIDSTVVETEDGKFLDEDSLADVIETAIDKVTTDVGKAIGKEDVDKKHLEEERIQRLHDELKSIREDQDKTLEQQKDLDPERIEKLYEELQALRDRQQQISEDQYDFQTTVDKAESLLSLDVLSRLAHNTLDRLEESITNIADKVFPRKKDRTQKRFRKKLPSEKSTEDEEPISIDAEDADDDFVSTVSEDDISMSEDMFENIRASIDEDQLNESIQKLAQDHFKTVVAPMTVVQQVPVYTQPPVSAPPPVTSPETTDETEQPQVQPAAQQPQVIQVQTPQIDVKELVKQELDDLMNKGFVERVSEELMKRPVPTEVEDDATGKEIQSEIDGLVDKVEALKKDVIGKEGGQIPDNLYQKLLLEISELDDKYSELSTKVDAIDEVVTEGKFPDNWDELLSKKQSAFWNKLDELDKEAVDKDKDFLKLNENLKEAIKDYVDEIIKEKYDKLEQLESVSPETLEKAEKEKDIAEHFKDAVDKEDASLFSQDFMSTMKTFLEQLAEKSASKDEVPDLPYDPEYFEEDRLEIFKADEETVQKKEKKRKPKPEEEAKKDIKEEEEQEAKAEEKKDYEAPPRKPQHYDPSEIAARSDEQRGTSIDAPVVIRGQESEGERYYPTQFKRKPVRLTYDFKTMFRNPYYRKYRDMLNEAATLVSEKRLDEALEYYYVIEAQNIPEAFRMMIRKNIDDIHRTIVETFRYSDTIVKVEDSGHVKKLRVEYFDEEDETEYQEIAFNDEE